jgi:membrane associated rhomboid family serine protease
VIPLKDTVRARGFPVVTAALIGTNLLVFLIQLRLSPEVSEGFLRLLGVVPARLLAEPLSGEWLTLFTSQFLHGGWLHLGSNLLALYVFGDNVEDRLGPWRFLLFYLACGVSAALVHIWFSPSSTVPTIGASGAISGVLAAYATLFPTAHVITLPIFFIPWFFEVPALLWIGVWFASQLLSGFLMLSADTEALGGIAWWAHVGGFVAGLVLIWPLRRQQPHFHPDEYCPW